MSERGGRELPGFAGGSLAAGRETRGACTYPLEKEGGVRISSVDTRALPPGKRPLMQPESNGPRDSLKFFGTKYRPTSLRASGRRTASGL